MIKEIITMDSWAATRDIWIAFITTDAPADITFIGKRNRAFAVVADTCIVAILHAPGAARLVEDTPYD